MSSLHSVKKIIKDRIHEGSVVVEGWVRFVRKSKQFCFVVFNDGSTQDNMQIVVDASLSNYAEISKMINGTSISVLGDLRVSEGKGQAVELDAKEFTIVGHVEADYPLQKKATSLEFLRENAHLRARTQLFGAVFRVKNALSYATHRFFQEQDFYWIHTPILTASDCEGAGEMFRVSTLDPKNPPLDDKGEIDYTKDYFGAPTHLTVSGQLNVECFSMGLNKVYTFGPTFRAENSHTHRHLSEFWMIEPEIAFAGLDEVADLAIEYMKYLINYCLSHCPKELEFIEKRESPGLVERLQGVVTSEVVKITYTKAIEILEAAHAKENFEFAPKWGIDLQTEHERYLTEGFHQGPVIVTDYPKDIKAFYMKLSDDGKTVRAMDVLVPGIGEIIGGSQREEKLDTLKKRIKEMNLSESDYWWYLDLRKYGTAPHGGFGLGFERMVQYVTGLHNIRDVMAFPRVQGNAKF
ncbi:MAG: asparagine--tRNA ligase [Bacteriovoracaceae bacterium]|mgnify:CR=1 FL=1|nr:asparagine--tRNA ligase [Bacteriovoracaceae bacterium]